MISSVIANAILELDPEGRFVSLDPGEMTVSYSSDITQHEALGPYVGDEEPCRAYLVAWLCSEGGYLPTSLELEKRYSIGRPKVGAELDILLNHADGTPYALIEVKAPDEYEEEQDKFIRGQLFDLAPHEPGSSVLSYATVTQSDSGVEIESITIEYAAGYTFDEWNEERPHSNNFPINYGEPIHEHFTKGGAKSLRADIEIAELEKVRKRLHDVLWRGSKPDNMIYEHVVKLFLAKIYDEKTTNKRDRFRFQIYYQANKRENATETHGRIDSLYREAYDRYLNLDGQSRPSPLNARDFTPEQTAFVVELLQGISFTKTHESGADLLGSFFEGITRDGFKQSKGLFFTHANLVTFVLKVLQVDKMALNMIQSNSVYSERLPYIIDPACGSGTFLLAAMRLITETVSEHREQISRNDDVREFVKERFPEDHSNRWAQDFIYGIDDSNLLAMSTKVNMVLHRDGNMHVYNADGLAPLSSYTDQRLKATPPPDQATYSRPVANSFDFVATNPPFSITLDPQTTRSLETSFELHDDSNSENLFLERWYQLLKPGGRLGAVLPESFFSTKENLRARVFLIDHFDVKAVVALPRHAFEPWTPTRTSLLFAAKKSPEDERRWVKSRKENEAKANAALARIKKSIRSLQRLRAAWESGDLAQQAAKCEEDASKLGVSTSAIDWQMPLRTILADIAEWEQGLSNVENSSNKNDPATSKKDATKKVQALSDLLKSAMSAVEDLIKALTELGLGNEVKQSSITLNECLKLLENAEQEVKLFSALVWSVDTTSKEIEYSYIASHVSNIGYKRTKRAEYERPNDLFVAEARDSQEEEEPHRVFNLREASASYQLVTDSGSEDMLSTLEAHGIWES